MYWRAWPNSSSLWISKVDDRDRASVRHLLLTIHQITHRLPNCEDRGRRTKNISQMRRKRNRRSKDISERGARVLYGSIESKSVSRRYLHFL